MVEVTAETVVTDLDATVLLAAVDAVNLLVAETTHLARTIVATGVIAVTESMTVATVTVADPQMIATEEMETGT